MATELFKDTMIKLAKDYTDFRKQVLNTLENGEGKKIELTFKQYVEIYLEANEYLEELEDSDSIEDSE